MVVTERPIESNGESTKARSGWVRRIVVAAVALALGLAGGWVIWGGDDDSTADPDAMSGAALATGWRSTGSPMPDAGFAVMAAAGDTVAFVGSAPDVGMVEFLSSDATENWTRVDEFPDTVFLEDPEHAPGRGLEYTSLRGLAGGDAGFVAVATLFDADGPENGKTPVILHSVDGGSWDPVDARELPATPVHEFDDVVAGPTGLVIVGTTRARTPFVWFSADGRTWVEAEVPFTPGAAAVTADRSGWMAVAGDPVPRSSPVRAFTSADGVEWTEVQVDEAPPPSALLPPIVGRAAFAANADTWVVAPIADGGTTTVWTSGDGGVRWREADLGGVAPDGSGYDVRELVAFADGFVIAATARSNGGDRETAYLLRSDDGLTWTRTEAIAEYGQLVPTDDALLASADGGIVHVWRDARD